MGPFPVFALWILFAGPGINEGGAQAIVDKGFRPALEQAVREREPYDSGLLGLKNQAGAGNNFGNQ